MSDQEDQQNPNPRTPYPRDPSSYRILDEIGSGLTSVVYKAECIPLDSTIVAIKSIDLDQSWVDLDNIRREANVMSLCSHPNILASHCSFAVDRRLWIVMPLMSAGSLQSIMSFVFPTGLPEECIAVVLKETLNALLYLHDKGHLHRDIHSGNILIDLNGSVKLSDFGVSVPVYQLDSSHEESASAMPMAINKIGFKEDIWAFGITALELARGRPPPSSSLPLARSLVMKIKHHFRFLEREERKFSKSFANMVNSCLDQDPLKRPSAEELLKHSFFRKGRDAEFLVKSLLQGLPSVEERVKLEKRQRKTEPEESSRLPEREEEVREWDFGEKGLELDSISVVGKEDDSAVGENGRGLEGIETVMGNLIRLKERTDKQNKQVTALIVAGGEGVGRERRERDGQIVEAVEKLSVELENTWKGHSELQTELEFLKLQWALGS